MDNPTNYPSLKVWIPAGMAKAYGLKPPRGAKMVEVEVFNHKHPECPADAPKQKLTGEITK
jgi:hypothetical protein